MQHVHNWAHHARAQAASAAVSGEDDADQGTWGAGAGAAEARLSALGAQLPGGSLVRALLMRSELVSQAKVRT